MSATAELVQTADQDSLPRGWTLATIEELIGDDGVFVDGDWVESKDQDPEGDVRLIQLADIGDGEYRDKSARFLTYAKAIELGCTFLKKGDVLVARMPDPLGRACIFPGDLRPAVTVVDVAIVRSANGDFDHRWLMYFVNAPAFRAAVASMQSGSTRKRISRGNLAKIALPVPPLDQQKRIVAEIEKQFSRLDEAVANLKRVKANLKRYKAAVLKAAVEGRLVETEAELAGREGRDYETGEQLLQRILQARRRQWKGKGKYEEPAAPDVTDLPELPEGWVWATVVQVADVASGNTPAGILDAVRQAGDVPWFKVGDMNHEENQQVMRHSEAWLRRDEVKELGLRLFPRDTVLFPKRGGAIATNKKRRLESCGCADLNVMGITPHEEIASYFFAWFDGVDLAGLSDGSNVPQINHKDIEPLLVPVPPLVEQHRIVAEADRRVSLIRETESQVDANLRRADRLRQSILAKAFSGLLVQESGPKEYAESAIGS